LQVIICSLQQQQGTAAITLPYQNQTIIIMKNSNQKVWFITGASKGLGLSLVKQLLKEGKKVAATSRSISELQNAIGDDENFLPLAMNLKDEANVDEAVEKTVTHFEQIDVVVNNAGYGLVGALEELTDEESKENFEVNVYGTLNVIRKVLPYLRAQKSGHIFNISSIGGFTGAFPGFGIYCATKFAVQGLTESLATEVKDFGIKATVVFPGYFRTNFLDQSSLNTPKVQLAEYESVRNVQKAHEQEINGNQPGDPVKAAKAMIAIAERELPLVHFFLGQDAYDLAYAKMKSVTIDLEDAKELSIATGFSE